MDCRSISLPCPQPSAARAALFRAVVALWEEEVLYGQVGEALARLDKEERQLLEGYFRDELSERAIAERLGCSHMTVHRQLRVAWRHLCQELGVEREFPGRRGKNSPKKGKKG